MIKIQRNDKCPCGSGKKYKKCCLLEQEKNAEILRAISTACTYEEIKEIINKPINIYRLKVELVRMRIREIEEEVSRTFEITGNQTLYDLHMNIQYGFDWDNDHMFSFYLSEKLYDRNNEYTANPLGEYIKSSFGKTTKSAAEAQLRDLQLFPNFSFWYLFDYGDELIHRVTVEGMREMTSKDTKLPKLINKVGNAPPQYEMEDNNDEW
jgi:hypothetical protein